MFDRYFQFEHHGFACMHACKNCVLLKKARDLVKKTGLDIDPKIFCERDAKYFPELFKEFGVDVTWELEENGCRATAKLK